MRRALAALGLIVGLVASQATGALAATSPYTFNDPLGDAAHGARTDILKVKIIHGTTVKVAVSMKRAAPFSSWGTNGNLVNIQIHINGITRYICAAKASVALCDGESIVPGCPVARARDALSNRYTFSVARSCLNDPAAIKLFVLAGAFGSTQISESDRAPDVGFSARVVFG